MLNRRTAISTALLLGITSMQLAAQSSASSQAKTQTPAGHGIKCLKADGSPCGNPEVSDLNKDIADFKATFGDAKSTVGDAQQNVADAKQVGGDAKQVGSDAKQPITNAAQGYGDAKQTVSDTKSAYGDAQQTKSDTQQTGQDVKQNLQDVKQTLKDLVGIKSLALKAPDGSVNCAQNDDSACSDSQTKALQKHAAQKTPPITVQREADQPTSASN
jgi:methyl-accepting chemotaxis protein